MSQAKPFTWTLNLTVHPMWVADGFSIDDERAHEMLKHAMPFAMGDEVAAAVIEAPKASEIAAVQGYKKGTAEYSQAISSLTANIPHAGAVRSALLKARALLDSVAFVATEGDTQPAIQQIDAALELINSRQGQPLAVEA